jgi:hypothetical protein
MPKVEALQSRNYPRVVLPKRVCSFDIETKKGRLCLAGLLIYTLHAGKYFPGRYRAYEVQDLSSLILFLKNFKGVIIGHNLFHFDYRRLRYECRLENISNKLVSRATTEKTCLPELDLERIIEKSVDTLWFACRQRGGRGGLRGLSLRMLVQMNLKRAAKGTIGRRFAYYWKNHRKRALAYNKNDCIITHKLWWQMLRSRELSFQIETEEDSIAEILRRFRITDSQARYLTGQRRILTHRQWARKLFKGEILPTDRAG